MEKVIYDCDPGHDDAVALAIAIESKNIDLLAITTAAGNQLQERTFNNARSLLKLFKRTDIPVYKGAPKPLLRDLIIADYVHGKTGIDGTTLPSNEDIPKTTDSANDAMFNIISNSKEKITIVATGPLTNVAILLLSHPEIKSNIKQIVFMGGAAFGGNYTPNAEFNIYVDPEAAEIVMQSGIPVYMFGLDTTMKAQFYTKDIEDLDKAGYVSKKFADLLNFFKKSNTVPIFNEGEEEGIHMHDPCAMAFLDNPDIFKMYKLYVSIDRDAGQSLGMTVVDYNQTTGKEPNVHVSFGLKNELLIDLIKKSMFELDKEY
ncbi:pyrimidine-specific ribonucleoside hydrolase RihA [Companilactobacillus sp. RD055328]|uniref:nucleoside hydrolase n=1 Tax=Companilactobacillus sp. RD055328 TaxID=2916634 RepID=UPI001FC81F1D|nr:nucleoside hydrolase [Companilactobacillus sp. RD055328]GKQ43436.1 pyrimidine-specific ribonucleoside hydrolase RihA [Companilactobacillus sp. RD055328]